MHIDFALVPAFGDDASSCGVVSAAFFDPVRARRELSTAAGSGFGAVVVDDAAGPLANLDIAANVAQWNPSLDVAATHWAGVISPTVAAADIAALDRLAGGRLSLRVIVEGKAGSTEERAHLPAWQRTDEYLTLLKRLWSNVRPIDHEGAFYRLRNARIEDKGPRGLDLPIRMSGRSGTAIEVAARHASVFELPLASFADNVTLMERVQAAAARCGRAGRIRFSAHIHADEEWFRWGAASLSRHAAAGISEFIVSGIRDAEALRRFEVEIIRQLDATEQRRRAALPAVMSHPSARFPRLLLAPRR